MKTHAENQVEESSSPETTHPFRMVVFSDSAEANRAAIEAADLVLQELGTEVESEKIFWDPATLNGTSLAHAAAQAAEADVILLAITGTGASANVKQWTEQWLKLRKGEGGLVAVIPLTEDGEDITDLVEYFRETAISANMDFLCHKQRVRHH